MLTTLLSNIQKITKDGKESYFGKRWSTEAGLKKTIDRTDFTFDETENSSPHKQLKEQILNSYQTVPDVNTVQFVEKLTNDSLSFLAKRRGMRMIQMQREAVCSESMSVLIRRIFDRMETYSLQMNAYLGCTELQTVVTRPAHVREVTRYTKARQPVETVTYFRARLTSPSWSLVIRGKDGVIEMFLLPINRVMGLSKTEAMFDPIVTLNGAVNNEMTSVEWTCDGFALTNETEELLAMELFTRLIQATQGQMEEHHNITEA